MRLVFRCALACVALCAGACTSATCPAGNVRLNGTGACVHDDARAAAGRAAVGTQTFSARGTHAADSGVSLPARASDADDDAG